MTDFLTMANRITRELRRSNLLDSAKDSINDAIKEAEKTRFWFNETEARTFVTVANQALYPQVGFTEIDDMYILEPSGYRRYIMLIDQGSMESYLDGTQQTGMPDLYHIRGETIRLYPVPSQVWTIAVDGYGSLLPSPLVADTDTNAWMTHGERYIRALAKSILLKDVVRDFGEATTYEAIAEDYRKNLLDDTTLRISTGQLRSHSV